MEAQPRLLSDRIDVSARDLEKADLVFHCSNGAWKCPGDAFASSRYVQKTAKYVADKDAYVVVVESVEVENVVRAALQEPKSPAAFLTKLAAWDFLAMRQPSWTVGHCVQSVTNGMNFEFKDVREPDVTCTRLTKPGWLLRLKTGGEPSYLNAAYDGPEENSGPPPPKRSKVESVLSKHKVDFRERSEYSFEVVQKFINALITLPKLFEWASEKKLVHAYSIPSPMRHDHADTFRCVYECLLLHTKTIHGSLRLLQDSNWLFDVLKDSWACVIVYQSLCCLYEAENAQNPDCNIPLRTVNLMQQLYLAGHLSLTCLIPRKVLTFLLSDGQEDAPQEECSSTFMLPGRLSEELVPKLFQEEVEVLKHAYETTPWLQEAMEGPIQLHLTGSFLCSRRGENVPSFYGKGPGDVDLFCLREQDIPQAKVQVEEAIRRWTRGLGEGGIVVKSWLKPTKKPCYAFETCTDGEDEEAQKVLDKIHPAAKRCDLYINSPDQVMKYHLPQMRACLTVSPTVHLFIAPTCAIAWISMVNVDYEYFHSRVKTPFQIIAARWLEGFVLCLREKDACAMTDYLWKKHMAAFSAKGCKQKPDEIPSFQDYFCDTQWEEFP